MSFFIKLSSDHAIFLCIFCGTLLHVRLRSFYSAYIHYDKPEPYLLTYPFPRSIPPSYLYQSIFFILVLECKNKGGGVIL